MAKVTLAQLNACDADGFVALAGHLVEDNPWVARQALSARPFVSKAAVHQAFCHVLVEAGQHRQLAVIRAHPDLGTRLEALDGPSRGEQERAGLGRLGDEGRRRLVELNTAYRAKFGFPFIFAVKGADPGDILAAFEARLANDKVKEHAQALSQVERIIAFRLDDLVEE